MISFRGQVVLVTGAGRGLGAAHARLLASRDATVVAHDAGVARDGTGADPALAESIASEIRDSGGTAHAATQNLATRDGCHQLVTAVLERHGRIDALVHNAGIVRYGQVTTTSDDEWQRMLDVNVSAAWWLCQSVWPAMQDQSYGRIVLTTSGFALRPIPGADVTGYSVGKAAQFGLMNGLAAEGADHGILVNAVAPVAATRIFRRDVDAGEMTPESVAPAVAVLASSSCRWSGQVLVAQDGTFAFDHMVRTEPSPPNRAATPEDVLAIAERDAPSLSLD